MAAQVPDSISMRYVQGSQSLMLLYFSTQTVANADTVDLSGYFSTVLDAFFIPNTAQTCGRTLSGTGNTLFTAAFGGTVNGTLHVLGNP